MMCISGRLWGIVFTRVHRVPDAEIMRTSDDVLYIPYKDNTKETLQCSSYNLSLDASLRASGPFFHFSTQTMHSKSADQRRRLRLNFGSERGQWASEWCFVNSRGVLT